MLKSMFIGTRLEALTALSYYTQIESIITEKESFIVKSDFSNQHNYFLINDFSKEDIFKKIFDTQVDIVLSSGFKFILPKSKIAKDKIYLNSHPSLLPKYKGLYAIKNAYKKNEEFIGSTLHYMEEKVDAGEIIFQEKFNIKKMTLDEVYQAVFSFLEPYVIIKGMEKIVDGINKK